jgi:3-methyladenine DNA glycosylase AlkD
VNTRQLARQVIDELRACTDQPRQIATQNYFPSRQKNLGVYAQDMRAVVRRHSKMLKKAPAHEVVAVARAVIDYNTLEGRQAAYEIVAGHKATLESLRIREVEALGKGIDNWASVDGFCCFIAGVCWRKGQIGDRDIQRWARGKDPWWRRAALVSTVPLNVPSRGGSGDSLRTLRVCEMLARDDHIMVHKALSWALRELCRWDRPAVKRFIESHDVPALVKREVGRKLATGRKSG